MRAYLRSVVGGFAHVAARPKPYCATVPDAMLGPPTRQTPKQSCFSCGWRWHGLHADGGLAELNVDEAWLAENISEGFRHRRALGKLKQEKTSLVLYEAQSDVEVDVFMPHSTLAANAMPSSKAKSGTTRSTHGPSSGWTLSQRTRPRRG